MVISARSRGLDKASPNHTEAHCEAASKRRILMSSNGLPSYLRVEGHPAGQPHVGIPRESAIRQLPDYRCPPSEPGRVFIPGVAVGQAPQCSS